MLSRKKVDLVLGPAQRRRSAEKWSCAAIGLDRKAENPPILPVAPSVVLILSTKSTVNVESV